MSFWNIHIKTTDGQEKNIDVHDESYIDLKIILSKLIERYDGMKSFFERAIHENSAIYKTKYITVTIMNEHLGFINFHQDLAVKTVKVAKRELYLLKNIL